MLSYELGGDEAENVARDGLGGDAVELLLNGRVSAFDEALARRITPDARLGE